MSSVVQLQEIDDLESVCSSLSRRSGTRICIITSAPLCCNPRVMKEADALTEWGFDVRVIASQHTPWTVHWDSELMAERNWKLQAVRWDSADLKARRTYLVSGLKQRGFQLLARAVSYDHGLAERAYCRLYGEQLELALEQSAGLYIAHNPQALPVAAAAARQHGTRFAFDAEDFHRGEFSRDSQNSTAFRFLNYLEQKYLPACAYVSSPSNQISDRLARHYGIEMPLTIHNCFPLADRFKLDGKTLDRQGKHLSLYWYSQIIGLDRGIQDAIRAASLINRPVQIHLRGDMRDTVRDNLLTLAREYSVADRIFFHPIVRPAELLSRAVEHDVGLALEPPLTENKELTVSNKLFTYLMAGLAIAATDTDGQRCSLENFKGAGFLYRSGDYSSLAGQLQRMVDNPEVLSRHKEAALRAAKSRWNWEVEGARLAKFIAADILQKKQVASG